MPGYYPMMSSREPAPMALVYPPARSYSLAKLNYPQPRDYALYEKVKVEKTKQSGDRRPRLFDQLRRQQSYDGDVKSRKMQGSQQQQRRPDGFDSLQLLGAQNDDRYLDRFMENSRSRQSGRDMVELPKGSSKSTLASNKSSNSKNSSNKRNNKENKRISTGNVSSEILALIGSLKSSASVDNLYESVEQINYRKSVEMLNRQKKIRSIHKTGHPLFDHLREERALATAKDDDEDDAIYSSNNLNIRNNNSKQRVGRSAGPRKISSISSPNFSLNSSGDDEQENTIRKNMNQRRPSTMPMPHHHQKKQQHQKLQQQQQQQYLRQQKGSEQTWRKTGSAGSESDDEWVIPRPKIGGRRRDTRTLSTDESDSSSKSSPMR